VSGYELPDTVLSVRNLTE